MERNYFKGEFEQYVKKNADQYRMIPSEKVWKGINSALHTRKKWYIIGFSALLLITGASVTWVMLIYPSKQQTVAVAERKTEAPTTSIKIPLGPENPANNSNKKSSTSDINGTFLSQDDLNTPFPETEPPKTPRKVNSALVISLKNNVTEIINEAQSERESTVITTAKVANQPSLPTVNYISENPTTTKPANSSFDKVAEKDIVSENIFSVANPLNSASSNQYQNSVLYPLTIESVVNSYKPIRLPKKISWQLYATPTVSYRRLGANKAFKNAGPFADPIVYPFTALTDVNKAVTHKPDMGLELGFSARYPISRTVKIRVGMQFNINKYDIKAYASNGEQATINLSGDNNAVTTWTYYRNYNGYKSDWLKNYYFSVSAPVGAEVKLFGGKKTNFGIAGTIQPTYIIRDRAYLLSTDYKNYAKVPWLVRRLNVNSSFETFVNFRSKNNTEWQIGPQVRYQLLSSFHKQYPLRENLFDFGLKIGITLNP